MLEASNNNELPAIPSKRYFTIGEVSDLCAVKPHVLRYWEQEFTQLRPMKRRGNRRYYQHHEVLLIRRIRELLYDQGFTISGARNRLIEGDAVDTATDVEHWSLYGLGGADTLSGTDTDDLLDGGTGDDVLWGYEGNDTIAGGSGSGVDTIYAGYGDDTVTGGDGKALAVSSAPGPRDGARTTR